MNSLLTFRNAAIAILHLIPLFFIHVTFLNRGGIGLQVPVNISVWFAALVFITLSLLHMYVQRRSVGSKFWIICTLSLSLIAIPTLYTDTLFLDLHSLRFVGIAAGVLFIFCLFQLQLTNKEKLRLTKSLFIGGVIQGLYGIMQYYILEPGNPLGFDAEINRPYGTTNHYNVYAISLVIALSFGLYLARIYWRKPKSLALILIGLFLIAVPILPSFSRVGLISFIAVFSLMIAWLFISRVKKTVVLTIAMTIVVGAMLNKVVRPEMTKTVITETATQSEASGIRILRTTRVGTRVTIFPVSFRLFLKSPITGHGFGTFRARYLEEQAAFIQEQDTDQRIPAEFYLSHPHNEILLWAIEAGIVGLIAILVPLFGCLILILKRKVRTRLLLLAMMFPFGLHMMVEMPFYNNAYLWLLFCTMVFALDNTKVGMISFKRRYLFVIPLLVVSGFSYGFHYLDKNRVAAQNHFLFYKYNREHGKFLRESPQVESFDELFDYEYMHLLMKNQLKEKNITPEFMRKYIFWAYGSVQSRPRTQVYLNLVQGLTMFQQLEKAYEISQKAVYLYPYDPQLQDQHKGFKYVSEEEAEQLGSDTIIQAPTNAN